MATSSDYRLGSIWLIRFDPSIGSEIQKTRPGIIVSATAFNQRSRVTVLPITSTTPKAKMLPVMIAIAPSETNGLDVESYAVCIDPATFDKKRLVKRLGQIEIEQIQQIKQILATYLDLEPPE
ncbi:type II toxin-antitoxin system PemK/MazF family toxin [Leptolyngbya sp. NIES-2104]|uniref:type II toxin-antitoxin system PemK/MazF family toxin n=1 Tax=Leptolyngbya sp. NIES-2104 TaxID=1552121 RepID=UPI00178CF21F|nr:type II toxin-antitoxin system PemK/MazF family toxin [Leptolyngbya sp. NIES-2104]